MLDTVLLAIIFIAITALILIVRKRNKERKGINGNKNKCNAGACER